MSQNEALVVDGEASESEDESSEESTHPRHSSGDLKLSMAGFSQSLSSVTATVEKHIEAFSRQATKDIDNITKGQLRRSSTQDSSGEDRQIKSPTHKSLLHKKLYEKNVALYSHVNSFFQELFGKNDKELHKVKEEMVDTEIHLQESAIAMQHSVHFCNELRESLLSLNTTASKIKFPNRVT